MTIQELGSVGEFIAAVATVATLGYLALQIRQNTRALRATALQTHNQNVQQAIATVAASPQNSVVWQRGVEDFDCLSPAEQAQFNAIVLGVFINSSAAYANHEEGLLSGQAWRQEWGILRFYLASSGGRRVWAAARRLEILNPGFVEFAESQLLERGS